MLSIFILENNFSKQSFLEEVILEIFQKHSWKLRSLKIFSRPDHLLKNMNERGGHHVFFLNLQITNDVIKGLNIAKQIRGLDPYATIIIINMDQEVLPLIFQAKIAALDVLSDNFHDNHFVEHLESLFENCIERFGITVHQDVFSIKNALTIFQIPFNTILYFETSDIVHKINLHTNTEKFEFYSSLKDIEKSDNRLFRCHKSFVVNPQNVKQIDKSKNLVVFHNGKTCFISKQKIKELTRKLGQYSKIKKQ